ncbi:40S ribosomal protein S20, partial [Trichinella sp. T8]
LSDNVHPIRYTTKYHMLTVEPFRRASCDEELTAVSIRSGVSHRHRPGISVLQQKVLIVELLAPNPFSPVQSWRKFSAVNGTTSLRNSITILPIVTDSKLNVNTYPYCLIHSSSAQTGFWDRSFGFGARAKLTRIVFPNSSLLFILSTAANASDSNSNSTNPKPRCLFTSKSNGIRTSTMSPNEMDYMKEKTVDDLSSTQHKIRISLTSRNVPALEKTCQELMNSARDKNVMPRGPVRYPTKTLRITCRKTPCGEGSKTWDRFQMRIHKRSIHFRSTSDVLKQITSVSVEPGVDIQLEVRFKVTQFASVMSTNRSVSFIQWRRAPQRPSSNRIWPNIMNYRRNEERCN